jgi:dTDP-4-dehydrorhamnose 3,5-epimerase-like enzyme
MPGGFFMEIWSRLYSRLKNCRLFNENHQENVDFSDRELLQGAHRELMCAHNMFARVVDEEMVDCAIYSINAAEKRYNYLYKKIKQEYNSESYARQNIMVLSQS